MINDLDEKVLGYVFESKSLTLKFLDLVLTEYLEEEYRPFVTIIRTCIKKYNEIPTIRMMERQDGWNEELLNIYNRAVQYKDTQDFDATNFMVDLEDVKSRYNTKVLLSVGKSIFKDNWNGKEFQDLVEANKLLRQTMATVDTIHTAKLYKEGTLSKTADQAEEDYKERRDNPEVARGIHVGLREFDRITNGLQEAELILIGGESGAGKSALAMNMAINAWRGSNPLVDSADFDLDSEFATDGANVIYFTIEMPFNPLRRRIDSNLSGSPLYGIRDGNLTPEEEERYYKALKFQSMYNKQFHIVDIPRGCTVPQIESKYLELLYEFQPELIVVDYVSLMTVDSDKESDWLNLGHLSEQLHEFSRTYGPPVITPVQLNRPQGHGEHKSPDQHRVGRSLMIPQNCNIMLNIDSRPDEENRPDMNLITAKMRDGEKGAMVLHKRFDIMRVYDDAPDWSPEVYNGEMNNE